MTLSEMQAIKTTTPRFDVKLNKVEFIGVNYGVQPMGTKPKSHILAEN